ncbi:hypothetical protein [Nostocoides sp. HKS02]|uniref:hypothetical protein n=1 Tax=Nostocoides sp. HKS02 TaxID=1813880 RepID=UPI0012B4E4C3|nr:hypothetical protein [Tetrasphaera sp. HKS02]QGN56696.1 hypothetical protein GKE56_00910 [Tetrasphaera sp. HKS02]
MTLDARRADRSERTFLLLAAAGLTVATATATIGPLRSPDAWWNLRAGDYLLATGRFVGPDPWSRFSTHQFVLTEWLGSVVAALLYRPFGAAALVELRTIGGVAIAALLYLLTRRVADLPYAVLATLVGLLGFSGSITERPQTLGLVLLLVSLHLWRSAALGGRVPSLWRLPLGWVFAMAHGYWTLGVLVGAATGAGLALDRRSWRTGLSAGLLVAGTVAAAAVTPVGPRLLLTPFQIRSAAAALVSEWQRASPTQPLVAIALALVVLTAAAWLRTGTSWWRVFHLLLALGLALSYARLSAPAVAITVPLAAEAAQRLKARRTARTAEASAPTRLELKAMAAGAVLVVLAGLVAAPASARRPLLTPTALLPAIAAIPSGSTVFDDFNVSSWMLHTYPHLQLVVDTRIEVFAPAYVNGYAAALDARPGWQSFVAHTGANWAVLRQEVPLAGALERAGWATTASRDGYVVLHRVAP